MTNKNSRDIPELSSYDVQLTPEVIASIREVLPQVGEDVVAAVIAEVPPYQDALSGHMGETIRTAVGVALGGFLSLASGAGLAADVSAATPPALQGAYDLGRGEARSGRTMEALLAAYRIGARVAWRQLASKAVEGGMEPAMLVEFSALVFAWIDEISEASAAGHADERATTGRVQRQLRERLARRLLAEATTPEELDDAAARAEWTPPSTLTAVLVPNSQVGSLLAKVNQSTLEFDDLRDLSDHTLLLVPDAHGHRRRPLMKALEGRRAVVGPAKPWREARVSYERARRVHFADLGSDTEQHLVELVLSADSDAREDLRAQVLAPLADLRPATAEKLTETLRSWLLHQGRREDVADELFIHPQTVRYRMGQLRDVYGDRLDDPAMLLALTVALG
ncbi:CdaR family transcriptional regulator [Nocardioides sp.]|uniref:PucR family transcriptional regulator n=1 Tax=Nocardioides sp. TaxID=35761 RepID=UPI0019A454C5|nr:helix-turn-helix domain-containing protein [Nocardioides sp.]MBC7277417.1 helix-turn-helix domain-containing protein [Nocardioides sp.]